MKKTTTSLIITGIIGLALGATATTYKSTKLSTEAYAVAKQYAQDHKMTIQNAASTLVLTAHDQPMITYTWDKTAIASEQVQIHLIRVSSWNPKEYVTIREIASSTANTGSYTWPYLAYDVMPDTFLQISCAGNVVNECRALPLISYYPY